jgi:hypothetical protein
MKSINQIDLQKPFLHQQMSQSAYSETQPKTPNGKQCRCRKGGERERERENRGEEKTAGPGQGSMSGEQIRVP